MRHFFRVVCYHSLCVVPGESNHLFFASVVVLLQLHPFWRLAEEEVRPSQQSAKAAAADGIRPRYVSGVSSWGLACVCDRRASG